MTKATTIRPVWVMLQIRSCMVPSYSTSHVAYVPYLPNTDFVGRTEIAFGDGGARHRDLSRAQNKSNHDKTNKSLQNAYSQIGALCESIHIPKPVAETTKMLYKMTDDDKLFKGKSQDAVIAGCLFIACRQHDMGRSFREIFQ